MHALTAVVRGRRHDRSDRRACRALVGVVFALCVALAADAEELRDETEYWVPAFGPFFDVLGQKASGSVQPGNILGTPLTTGGCNDRGVLNGDLCFSSRYGSPQNPPVNYPKQLDRADASNDTSITPLVGFSLELMTPRLLDALLYPRVFVRGEFAASFGFERNLAGDGRPDTFVPFDPSLLLAGQTDYDEAAIKGQGTRTRIQVERWVYSGGVGPALTTSWFERRVRIKPSFEYLRQEIELIGVVHRALKLRIPVQAGNFNDLRLIAISQTKTITLDGFGPGLEVEVDTARVGPFLTSTYIMGRGYYFFDNLEHTLTATNSDPNGCNAAGQCEMARWTYDIEPWAWRAGVGFRLRWLPE
jgi:hypothetical protein